MSAEATNTSAAGVPVKVRKARGKAKDPVGFHDYRKISASTVKALKMSTDFQAADADNPETKKQFHAGDYIIQDPDNSQLVGMEAERFLSDFAITRAKKTKDATASVEDGQAESAGA